MNEQVKYKWLPSEPTPAMLEAEQFASSLAYESHEFQAIEVYKAMWQAAPAVEQEPVGKIVLHDCSYIGELFNSNDNHVEGTPLYTHPLKREPLSEREINELEMKSYQLLFDKWNGRAPDLVDHFRAFARAIEKAHGIGETKCT